MDVADTPENVLQQISRALSLTSGESPPTVGNFVATGDNDGIGKLVEIEHDKARVAFFSSIAERHERTYPLHRLRPVRLPPQTRVYTNSASSARWRMGRVVAESFADDAQLWYDIRFPNHRDERLPESALEVRCFGPTTDPTEVLAWGGAESQFLHDRRKVASKALICWRAASRGLTGLMSSSIELLPHQLEVARRILEDPVQRYLLADEVGLGKTIEAGIVIRQCLLDEPDAQVVILVPPTLVRQWQQELKRKFHVQDFPNQLRVLPFGELPNLDASGYDLLVIDEAHRLSPGGDATAVSFAHLREVAEHSRRLLLISATPIFGNERATLVLLHLLDPVTYRLDDVDGFRQRIERRQEFGQRLLALKPNLPTPILRKVLEQTRQSFPDDQVVQQLGQNALTAGAKTPTLIADLKRHIAETYRLHQRLLRTRRRDLEGWELHPRQSEVVVEVDEDPRVADAWRWLDDWWDAAHRATGTETEGVSQPEIERKLARRYALLFEALGRGVEEFVSEVEHQDQLVADERLVTFEGEAELLAAWDTMRDRTDQRISVTGRLMTFTGLSARAWIEVTPRVATVVDSAMLLVRAIQRSGPEPPKVVIFSSSTNVARELVTCLRVVNGEDRIFSVIQGMSADQIDLAVARFAGCPHPSALVCDESGEEGLNLHFAHGIVHADLPLAPSRIEQRIGRLDRFGRQLPIIYQRLILPSDDDTSPWQAWYELLNNTFRIFDSSVSEIHFILDRLRRQIVLALFRTGTHGLRHIARHVEQKLDEERRQLDEQYALDRLAIDDDEAKSLFAQFKGGDDLAPAAVDQWLGGVLQLERTPSGGNAGAFSYQWDDRHTLLPELPWRLFLKDGLDRPVTYRRATAIAHSTVSLLRPGFSLIDRIEQFMRWDDRGTAFATWRLDPSWNVEERGEWLGFRLCYLIEANQAALAQISAEETGPELLATLRRRADALLPPWIETIYINTNLEEVKDPELTAILDRPYRDEMDSNGRWDFNLGSRPAALESRVDSTQFVRLCRQVRERSEQILRSSPRFQTQIEAAQRQADIELKHRNERLRYRVEVIRQETGRDDPTIAAEIRRARAILTSIGEPSVRLDAIGFYIVSNRIPPVGRADE